VCVCACEGVCVCVCQGGRHASKVKLGRVKVTKVHVAGPARQSGSLSQSLPGLRVCK